MKEAALKDKPERRAWEEAAPFFKWTCGDYEAVHAARARNDAADRLEAAVQFRHAGNEKFAQEEFDDALMQCASCMLAIGLAPLTCSEVPAIADVIVIIWHSRSARFAPQIALQFAGTPTPSPCSSIFSAQQTAASTL